MKKKGNRYNKPKTNSINELFTIELWLEKERKCVIVRDCNYNEKDKIFTQIDDLSNFHLYEIYEWTRQ